MENKAGRERPLGHSTGAADHGTRPGSRDSSYCCSYKVRVGCSDCSMVPPFIWVQWPVLSFCMLLILSKRPQIKTAVGLQQSTSSSLTLAAQVSSPPPPCPEAHLLQSSLLGLPFLAVIKGSVLLQDPLLQGEVHPSSWLSYLTMTCLWCLTCLQPQEDWKSICGIPCGQHITWKRCHPSFPAGGLSLHVCLPTVHWLAGRL